MSIRFLLDENLRGAFWQLVQRHNSRRLDPIDAVRVGDINELPLGVSDPVILEWCERENRILVSLDKKTVPGYIAEHLQSGRHVPGLFLIGPGSSWIQVVDFLALVTYASEPEEWRDWIKYL